MLTPPLPAATTSFTPPLLIVSNQLYLLNMKTGLLQGRLGRLHCMQRSWSAPDKRPQLPNERQLHHCLHVTDGWQRWQIGGINWWGYQGQTSLHFRASLFFFFFFLALVLSASRCIFIQIHWEDERDRWPRAHVMLRWFNGKHLHVSVACVYKRSPSAYLRCGAE